MVPLHLITENFYPVWGHLKPATAPVLAGVGAAVAVDGAFPANIDAPFARSLRLHG